jgi:hypothetical protein
MDGIILIDQAKVLAGNVTPGDTPGFPVTISKAGSYRLSGNLTVPGGGKKGIVLTTSNVTIDLNGFQISSKAGTGQPGYCGITDNNHALSGIAVRNGTISSLEVGIMLQHSQAVVECLQVFRTTSFGIQTGPCSIVKGNTIRSHNMLGIEIGEGSIVSGNIISSCDGGAGMVGSGSVVCDNAVSDNFTGLSVGSDSIVKGNTAIRNVGLGGCHGIAVGANSTIIGNTASQNSVGISITCPCTVLGNTAVNNAEGNIAFSGTGCSQAYNTAP